MRQVLAEPLARVSNLRSDTISNFVIKLQVNYLIEVSVHVYATKCMYNLYEVTTELLEQNVTDFPAICFVKLSLPIFDLATLLFQRLRNKL